MKQKSWQVLYHLTVVKDEMKLPIRLFSEDCGQVIQPGPKPLSTATYSWRSKEPDCKRHYSLDNKTNKMHHEGLYFLSLDSVDLKREITETESK